MSAHDPRDQERPGPSIRDVLASCAAARAVSTPPRDTSRAESAPAREQRDGHDADRRPSAPWEPLRKASAG